MTGEGDARAATWFRRPLYRDWALWLGVVFGLVIEVATSRHRQVGVVNDTPIFLVVGVFMGELVVGTVRQFRFGMSEDSAGNELSPLA